MLNSIAAEFALANLISQHRKLSPLRFTTPQILEVARKYPLGRGRLSAAEPHLKAQYGIPLKNGRLHLLWESLPASVLLDHIMAVDATFGYLGWNYALDVTVNPQAVEEKYGKLEKLLPMLKELELERVGVLLLRSDAIDPATFLKLLPRHEHFCFSL